MSLRLIIEHAPHPQPQTERLHHAGDLSIGRGAEADWRLDDPEMFISRKHCVISGRDGSYTVTDASRGGLYIDGSDTPLGAGIAASVQNGTRLRLGDVIIRAEVLVVGLQPAGAAAPEAPQLSSGFGGDDFFAPRPAPPPPPPRPESLPQPFEGGPAPFAPEAPVRPVPPPLFDDPFTLDPLATPAPAAPAKAPAPDFSDFSFAFQESPPPAPEPEPVPAAPIVPPRAAPPPPPPPPPPPAAQPVEAELIDAFCRGAGIERSAFAQGGTPAEMEALGRRFRLLAEGLVQLLRIRAQEKNSARIAQTLIGAVDVNPLKFMVTPEDAVGALLRARAKGYLGPDEAITAAYRDLAEHQLRTWSAVQSALRQMIDRFDPAALEAETENAGPLRSLVTGSRSARLWQLYTERYREIAKSAEDRFLGEVGADFRDAYEDNKENHR